MQPLEAYIKHIVESDRFLPKVLIMAALFFSILGIPLVLGYIARYINQVKEKREYTLPQWEGWITLLVESIELIILILLYCVIPIMVVHWLTGLIAPLFGILEFLMWLPFSVLMLVCPIVSVCAYYLYLEKQNLGALFYISDIWKLVRLHFMTMWLPTIAFWGIMYLGFPLFGFTIPLGLLFYLSFLISYFENPQSE